DARTWTPAEPGDLIVSNASLQLAPGHTGRSGDWTVGLTSGFPHAGQAPGNFDARSHVLTPELAASRPCRGRLDGGLRHADVAAPPRTYLERLTALGCTADVWETTYLHLLQGEDPVLDWVEGTGLRPVLTALADDPQARDAFVAEYRTALRTAYP